MTGARDPRSVAGQAPAVELGRGRQSSTDMVDVTTPVADAGADHAVNEGSIVGLGGRFSLDPTERPRGA